MVVDRFALARSYDVDQVSAMPEPLEPWPDQLNVRARSSAKFEYFTIKDLAVRVCGQEAVVRGFAQFFKDIRVLDIVLEVQGSGLPEDAWSEELDHAHHLIVEVAGEHVIIGELLDRTYSDLTGMVAPRGSVNPKRTTFGIVVFHTCESGRLAVPGITVEGIAASQRVRAHPNRMDAYASEWTREDQFSYEIVAALCGRARHLATRIIESASELAVGMGSGSSKAITLDQALEVRREAVLSSIEMTGIGYLGTGRMVRFYNAVYADAAVSPSVERALAVSADGLQQLSDGLFSLANERNGRWLSYIALIFTAVSVFFAAIAMGEFFGLPFETRWWVYGAWAIGLASLVAAIALWKQALGARVSGSS